MNVDANVFLELVLSGHSGLLVFYKIFPRNASGGVNLTSVCGLVATGNNRPCELPGYVVRPRNSTITSRTPSERTALDVANPPGDRPERSYGANC